MLVLRLSTTHFFFARMEQGRVFEYKKYQLQSHLSLIEQLRDAVDHCPLCQPLPAEGVVVSIVGAYTPVPMADFQEEVCDTFYNYCVNPEVKHRVFYDLIPAANVALLFGLPELTCQAIEDVFEQVHYVSAMSPVMKRMLRHGAPLQLLVNIHEQAVDLMCSEGNRLSMINAYSVQTADDVAYYTLNVINQLGLKPENLRVSVVGSSAERNPIIARLLTFVPHVVPVLPSQEYDHEMASDDELPYDLITYLLSKIK